MRRAGSDHYVARDNFAGNADYWHRRHHAHGFRDIGTSLGDDKSGDRLGAQHDIELYDGRSDDPSEQDHRSNGL